MKKIINILTRFTAPKLPKVGFSYVFYNATNKEFAASDGTRLLVIKYNLSEVKENLLFNVNNKLLGKHPIYINGFIAFKESEIEKFPDYERVLIKKSKLTKSISSEFRFADCIMNAGVFCREHILIKFSKKYNKLNLYQENTRIHFTDASSSIMLSGLVDYGKKAKMMLSTKLVISSFTKNQ